MPPRARRVAGPSRERTWRGRRRPVRRTPGWGRPAGERLTGPTGIPARPMESPRGVNDPWLHMASNCLGQADLVLLLGKRLGFPVRVGGAPAVSSARRFVQVDWDAEALDRSGRVTLGLVTDPALLAVRLAADA